jgi:hypothetical protein
MWNVTKNRDYTKTSPSDVLHHHFMSTHQGSLLRDRSVMTTSTVVTVDPSVLTLCPTIPRNRLDVVSLNPATGLGLPNGNPGPSLNECSIAPASQADTKAREGDVPPGVGSAESSIPTESTLPSSYNPSIPRSDGIQCRVCLKVKDRKSRAEACEKKHKGIRDYPCSGACGNGNWYVPCMASYFLQHILLRWMSHLISFAQHKIIRKVRIPPPSLPTSWTESIRLWSMVSCFLLWLAILTYASQWCHHHGAKPTKAPKKALYSGFDTMIDVL